MLISRLAHSRIRDPTPVVHHPPEPHEVLPAPRPDPPPLRPEPTDAGAAETEGWWPSVPEDGDFHSLRRWAGRLAFPVLALAVLAAWRGVKVSGGEASALPAWGWWALAAAATVLGLLMVGLRHARRAP